MSGKDTDVEERKQEGGLEEVAGGAGGARRLRWHEGNLGGLQFTAAAVFQKCSKCTSPRRLGCHPALGKTNRIPGPSLPLPPPARIREVRGGG